MKILETNFNDDELKAINSVLKDGNIGFGANVFKFETAFKSFSNKEFNIAVNSASAAAFMIFAYLKECYGTCDVYTTSLAFTSPAWAAKHFGHNLIWIDVNDSLLFNCNDYLKKRINNNNVKVVMPILYGGVSTIDNWELYGDEIVVVDSAHCITPTIKNDFVFFSFHPTKPVCTSDGGMISTDMESANEYFRSYRNFGREVNENLYDITQEGFKFYMNNLNATIGLISLSNYHKNLEIKKENYIFLKNKFKHKLLNHDNNSSYYFATLITDNADELNKNFNLAKHYPLLHKTKYYYNDELINTELLYSKIVNLPLYDLDIYNSRSWG
jgi:dTDP-4-amino-4,6-dideoxygalactose transaminase